MLGDLDLNRRVIVLLLMPMQVMLVRDVRVRVAICCMKVRVAMRPFGHRGMEVDVVSVIVAVRMLVFERMVLVFVRVSFHQVQEDACDHQRGSAVHPRATWRLPHQKRNYRAHEGSEREDRAGSRRTERSLCEQIEAQAHSIPRGAHEE